MRLIRLFFSLLLLASCATEETPDSGVKTEVMPAVDLQLYDTIHFQNEFRFLVPKEFSVSTNTFWDSRLCYNDLIREEHVYVFSVSKEAFKESIDARQVQVTKDSLFIYYADEQFESFQKRFNEVSIEEEYLSIVKNRQTKYFRFTGMQFGFPEKKSVSLRFYEGMADYYIILYWTLADQHEENETKEDVIMMSFDETKKGQPES